MKIIEPFACLFVAFLITFYMTNANSGQLNDSEPVKEYTFGVVPQESAMILAKKWMPIFNEIEKETGIHLVFKTNKTIPEFEAELALQHYDFAYMNPYHYTVFHVKSGYRALAKQGNKMIKGILVVKKGSNITSLQDLKNETIAFPAPAAFAATVIPQSILKKEHISIKSKYVSSHESVYKNVAYGNFVAGGGIERTFYGQSKDLQDQLDVIWVSKGYTPHAFSASPNVPAEVADKVIQALLKFSNTPEGQSLLKAINFKSIVPALDSDWDDVRSLDIELLADLKVVSG